MGKQDSGDSFAALFESQPKTAQKRVHRGDRIDVRVVAVGRDAVFVDCGQKQEGFIERADLAGPDGPLALDVGASISAVVAEADGERIRLTPVFVRRTESSTIDDGDDVVQIPRARGGPLLVVGAHIRGAVTGVERYGLFVQIEATQGRGGRGLVPTAETGAPRGADLRKLFPIGTAVEAKILNIDVEGKIRLSIKAQGEDVERKDYADYAGKQSDAGAAPGQERSLDKPGAPKRPDVPRNFGTLGDLLPRAPKKR